ncbi:MAG: DUF3667 domain-containing protein [Pseudomonadota bacterium]
MSGVIGRAIEKRAGEPPDGHFREQDCLNCGTPLTGGYCHACGQQAHVHRTLSALFDDLLHGLLHFEGKIWRTLPLLVWNPGELTRRYIDGQRARFISPIALFLFSVFLMFAAIGLTGGFNTGPSEEIQEGIAQDAENVRGAIARIEAQRARAVAAHEPTAKIDATLDDRRAELAALTIMARREFSRSFHVPHNLPSWLQEGVGEAARNPELLLYKLKTIAYKFSWALIPLSVPFLWLLFPFSRRFKLYDHTIFVTYSLCFMIFLVAVVVVLDEAGLQSLASVAFFVPPIHMYRQLKGAYALGFWATLWRTLLLTLFALVIISLFVTLLVGLGLFD